MTSKQQKFICRYLINNNATLSAIEAGYSKKTAYSIGQRLLKNVEIQKTMKKYKTESIKKMKIKLDEIIADVYRISKEGKNDYVKLKALDMLMRHCGAYLDEDKLIQRLKESDAEQIINILINKNYETE